MRFLLSIHDIWPGNFTLVAAYLSRLRSLGFRRVALLVVPKYHDLTAMESAPEFLAWLQQEAGQGSEIFLHGYRHWMPELAEGSSFSGHRSHWGQWVNRKWVGQEAEFCGLSQPARTRLLDLGIRAFQAAHLECRGFVAPTWHGSPALEALKATTIPLLETRFYLHDLVSGRWKFAPPLAWISSAGKAPNLAGGGLWLKLLLKLPLIKVAIHPGDLDTHQAMAILEEVLASGRESTYQEIFRPAPSLKS